jgi:hypothetical protein
MGPHIIGAALPHPDNQDPQTMFMGVLKRIAAKLPKANPTMLKGLSDFALDWLEKHCKPLSPADDLSFESWIESRNYPEYRKQELRDVYAKIDKLSLPEKVNVVKSFMKDENYPSYKHGRGIYSRLDEFKVLFGPICSAIESDLYKNPEFIKHVPVSKRPEYISEFLDFEGVEIGATDYTSFESSFCPTIMEHLDFVLFRFYLQYLDNPLYTLLFTTLKGENKCVFKWFTLYLRAKRMSGEMNTSLSNGFANLMVMKFLCFYFGYGDPKMVVEGDDGLTKTPTGKYPTSEQFAQVGFKIKIEIHKNVESASFCGIIYDPVDKINITDPLKVLAQFGWAASRYARSGERKMKTLLRLKSLSYLYQYPGCPIVQELALYGLRVTKSYDVRNFIKNSGSLGSWERDKLLEISQNCSNFGKDLPTRPVPPRTRELMCEKFGIPAEMQVALEKFISLKNDLEPFAINLDWPDDWITYFNRYCHPTGGKDMVLDYTTQEFDPWHFLDVKVFNRD